MTMITDNIERRTLMALGMRLPRPSAILCVSAHWETQGRTHLTAQPNPPTIHDFRGFPQALYDMRYPAPGSVDLVERVAGLLGEDRVLRDSEWGFDHGTWGVLQPQFPAADIPVVAMSLDRALSAQDHASLGAALAHGAGQRVEHRCGLLEADAGVGDRHPVLQGHAGLLVLTPFVQVALDHQAHDARIARSNLPGNIVCHFNLFLVLLAAVGVRHIDHDLWRQT